MISAAHLLKISFLFFLRLIIFIACSLKDSQKVLIQSLPLYTSCLFSMLLNDNIVQIQTPDGIFSSAFVVNEFQDYQYIHQPILSNIQDLHK